MPRVYKTVPLADRFWRKVNFTTSCWLWLADTSESGYGSIRVDGRLEKAHRVAYQLVKGPIPAGLTIDHLCRRRACVNPSHLEAVTKRENTLRGTGVSAERARQTHCLRGHEFNVANTRITRGGSRACRACVPLFPSRLAKRRRPLAETSRDRGAA